MKSLSRKASKDPKKIFDKQSRVESYLKDVHHQQQPSSCGYGADSIGKLISNSESKLPNFDQSGYSEKSMQKNGIDWKITMLDGTQTVELNMSDELGKQKKTHVCLFCGKIYNRKYGLKIHLRTHTGYKPLKCKVCSRPFSDPSNLNKHVRLHSQGDTPYRCPYCGKILVRKRDLDRHIMSRHSGKEISDLNLQDSHMNDEYNDEEMIASGNTDDEDSSDLEDIDQEDHHSLKIGQSGMFSSNNQAMSFFSKVQQDRSQAASPTEISIQKIIESSQ